MRPTINNPVIKNPWTPLMPNNFCGSQAAKKIQEKLVQNCMKATRRPRSISIKLQMAKIYAEQLSPLYPFLSKAQVKAAIVLANNNFHQSRLLLDLSNKFRKVTPLNLALSYQPNKLASTRRADDNISPTRLISSNNDQQSAASHSLKYTSDSISLAPNPNRPNIDNSSCIGSDIFSRKECIDNCTSNLNERSASTSSYNSGISSIISDHNEASTVTDNSSLSVYDFSESECNPEPIQTWASHKAVKKVGVSIVRCQKGYKAFLL